MSDVTVLIKQHPPSFLIGIEAGTSPFLLDDDNAEATLVPAHWVSVANLRRSKLVQTTEWFDGASKPTHIGWYERYFVDCPDNLSEPRMHYWDGELWRRTPIARPHHFQVGSYPAWRGLVDQNDTEGICWDRKGCRQLQA